jgi:hypothetical protein
LVFQLKTAIGTGAIMAREHDFIRRAIDSWSANPKIRVLGNPTAKRLGIVSFTVQHGDQFLHHNFVVALLNDLFGIQARGGCSCAGPYGHRLLDIDLTRSRAYEREILRGCEGVKPGWVRVNFNYFLSERVFDYILQAVHFVANEGWKLLPLYAFEPESGQWQYRDWTPSSVMRLIDVTYEAGRLGYRSRHSTEPESALDEYPRQARRIVAELERKYADQGVEDPQLSENFESLRWFPLPSEALRLLRRRA